MKPGFVTASLKRTAHDTIGIPLAVVVWILLSSDIFFSPFPPRLAGHPRASGSLLARPRAAFCGVPKIASFLIFGGTANTQCPKQKPAVPLVAQRCFPTRRARKMGGKERWE